MTGMLASLHTAAKILNAAKASLTVRTMQLETKNTHDRTGK